MSTSSNPTVAIIQARLGSSRLPRKVLANIGGAPLLARVVERVRRAARIDRVVVATSTSPQDDEVERLCNEIGVASFRGSEEDVLDRFVGAAQSQNAGWIVRVNADNPFLAPEYLDELVAAVDPLVDYLSFRVKDRPAMLTPVGLFAEVLSRSCLERAARTLNSRPHREHVTLGIYTSPDNYEVHFLDAPPWASETPLRLTLDTADDLRLLREIAAETDPLLSAKELCEAVALHTPWVEEMLRLNEAQPK